MLTFREIQDREGYYYNRRTGDLLRVVYLGRAGCAPGASWPDTLAADDPDDPQFELVTPDVLTALAEVQRAVAERYGAAGSGRLVSRHTAVQPDCRVVTEEAVIRSPTPPSRAGGAGPGRWPGAGDRDRADQRE